MEKITKYVSNDGEEFDTRKECEEYEDTLNVAKNKDIVMLGLDYCKLPEDDADIIGEAEYLFILNDKAMLTYNKCASYFGLVEVQSDKFGEWLRYDDNSDEWCSIDEEIEKLTNLKTKLMKVKDGIDGSNRISK